MSTDSTRPPGDETTRVPAPPAEDATGIMSGEAADVTRVLPAAGSQSPPQPPPVRQFPPAQPTLIMTRRRGRGWLWLLAAVVAIAAVAGAVWFAYLRPVAAPEPSGAAYVGTWAPLDGRGGGLVIARSGDAFKVTQYDGTLAAVRTSSAALRDDALSARLDAAALGLDGLSGEVLATLQHDAASDRLRLTVEVPQRTVLELVRREVLLPASSPSPSPSPTPSPTPTSSWSPSPTSSPSPSTSPVATADQQVVAAVTRIQVAIDTWSAHNGGVPPEPGDVAQTGAVADFLDPWPLNPFSGEPMVSGTDPGDYVYELLDEGAGYRLTGYLSDGGAYSAP